MRESQMNYIKARAFTLKVLCEGIIAGNVFF